MTGQTVAVIGASVAGTRVATALREEGYDGSIVLVGAEQHEPYDRPPLSKDLLTAAEPDVAGIRLLTVDDAAAHHVDLVLGRTATALEPGDRTVVLDDGRRLRADAVVLATGAAPCRLSVGADNDVHYLRTLDDARGLRAALDVARRVVVVGAGFIGCEVAAAARGRAAEVTVVDADPRPFDRFVGHSLASTYRQLHEMNDVRFRWGRTIADVRGRRGDHVVELDDDTRLAADTVVVGVGVRPVVGWLDGLGIAGPHGVLTDATGATALPGVYAVGDVAAWPQEPDGAGRVAGHWTAAIGHAETVARRIVHGRADPWYGDRYVWSDQYGVRIQVAGAPRAGDDLTIIDGVLGEPLGLVAQWSRDGTPTGVVALGNPREFTRARRRLQDAAVPA